MSIPESRSWPQGTVAFLYTDIEGSTKLWQAHPGVMPGVMARHDRILRDAIEHHQGIIFRTVGDGCCAAFAQVHEAVEAALDAQQAIQGTDWEDGVRLRVRMSLHAGPVELQDGEYSGHTLNRVARLLSAANGGQVLVSAVAQELVRDHLPLNVDVIDLGEHHLKDLQRPEHIFQLVSPDLRTDHRGLVTEDVRPTNLPRERTAFVGREGDIASISALLRRGDVQLVTLTGPGGTGKTRLSLRVAAEARDDFRDGVFFVPLAPVADPSLVGSAIAASLGIVDVAGQTPEETLQSHVRHKEMLLVLDNFEHLLDAAPIVSDLLACPGLKILVTSRSVLRLSGEHEWGVSPLTSPDPRHLPDLEELSHYDAVALFIQRARAVKPDFTVTNDNAPALAEICHRLDGLPLAIELAAARVRLFPPQALLSRLQNRLSVLTGGARDLPTRQQTLRGAIDWSYSLLAPGEQQLFARVSVFSGGFSLEAAETVCTSDGDLELEVLDGVGSLVEKSLLRQEGEDEPRFVMLETINEYAAERLDELGPSRDATRRAHAAYFADFGRRALDDSSHEGRMAAVAALTPDIENLRTAWRYWIRERHLNSLNNLVDALWLLYDSRGRYRAAIELTAELLDVLASSPPSPERIAQEITLRASQARALLVFEGYTQEVEEAFTRAEAAGGEEELPQLFPVLRSLAAFYTYRGEFEKGTEVAQKLLHLADVQDDAGIRTVAHLVLGECFALRDKLHLGLEHLNTSIRASEEQDGLTGRFRVGNDPGIAALTTSALFLWMLGFPDEAIARLNRAIERATKQGHPSTLAYATFHAGFVHFWRREPELARERALGALAVAEEHDLQLWKAVATFLLGASRTWLGEVEEGLADMRRGLASYQGLRTPPVFWPMILFVQAEALTRAGMPMEGLAGIEEALEIVGSQAALSPLFLVAKGDLLLDHSANNASDAETWYRHGLVRARELDARMLQLRAAMGLCRAVRSPASAEEARNTLAAVVSTFTEGFTTPDLREAMDLLRGTPDDKPLSPSQPA